MEDPTKKSWTPVGVGSAERNILRWPGLDRLETTSQGELQVSKGPRGRLDGYVGERREYCGL